MKGKNKRKKYHSYRGEVGKIADNLLKQNFHTTAPNQKWVTDVSEFKCAEGKLYLSPIKDLFNGEIIAYDVARNPSFEQISRIMKRAVARLDGATPILYSDQGWQYQMASYQSILKQNGIISLTFWGQIKNHRAFLGNLHLNFCYRAHWHCGG
ncbi:transposase family protein [Glaesserella parasuis]|nr:transposase family protein [Glaesserella parasuis]